MDIMRPGSLISAKEAMQLIEHLPTGGAFLAALAGARRPNDDDGPPEPESPAVQEFRRARRFRGWTPEVAAIFDIRDMLAGKPSPRPSDGDGVSVSSRQVADVIPI